MKDDLDLSVQPPGGNLISFENPVDSVTGGELAFDRIPTTTGTWEEYITFVRPGIPVGNYEVCVTSFTQVADADVYTVVISENGSNTFSETRTNNGAKTQWCTSYQYPSG